NSGYDQQTQGQEPISLIERGLDIETEGGARFVPDPIIVASDNAEGVVARTKIGIEGLPAISDVLPILVVTFKLIAKAILLRSHEAKCGVVDFQISRERWQAQARTTISGHIIELPIGVDLFDMHRWRKLVEREMARINDADTIGSFEPELPIRRLGRNG